MSEADRILNFNYPKIQPYKRNFLQQSVCEFRFPTLMELGESKPPIKLVNSLRKEYPHLELANEVTLGVGSKSSDTNNTHIFRSPKLNWAISIRQSSLTIETTSYQGFDSMKERITFILNAVKDVIDTDFFTRVGLRYRIMVIQDSIYSLLKQLRVRLLVKSLLHDQVCEKIVIQKFPRKI